MFVQTGYIYHIKDDFSKTINDKGLMINHENGRSRPTYLTIVENDILWFIPLSSKVSKYKTIIKQKIQKYGKCNTILIRTIAGRKVVILLQNAFPTLEKYIDHPHIRNGAPMKVSTNLISEISPSLRASNTLLQYIFIALFISCFLPSIITSSLRIFTRIIFSSCSNLSGIRFDTFLSTSIRNGSMRSLPRLNWLNILSWKIPNWVIYPLDTISRFTVDKIIPYP